MAACSSRTACIDETEWRPTRRPLRCYQSGSPMSVAAVRMIRFGLRRAVMSRRREVKTLPDVHVHLEEHHEQAFLEALQHVADDDHHQHQRGVLERQASPAESPTIHAHHQSGGWMRSMEWSNTFPKGDDCSVTRASLPSTVSRKVMGQAASRPSAEVPFPERPHRCDDQHQTQSSSPCWV